MVHHGISWYIMIYIMILGYMAVLEDHLIVQQLPVLEVQKGLRKKHGGFGTFLGWSVPLPTLQISRPSRQRRYFIIHQCLGADIDGRTRQGSYKDWSGDERNE